MREPFARDDGHPEYSPLLRLLGGRGYAEIWAHLIPPPPPDGRALDLGCGEGRGVRYHAPAFPRGLGVGVDLSSRALRDARTVRLPPNTAYVLAPAQRLPFPEGSFHLVTSVLSLHHMRRPLELLREAWRILTPGGWLGIVDLCADHPLGKAIQNAERIWVDPGSNVYGARVLQALMRQAGFVDVAVHPGPRPLSGLLRIWIGRRPDVR